jgi:hypothetical protein
MGLLNESEYKWGQSDGKKKKLMLNLLALHFSGNLSVYMLLLFMMHHGHILCLGPFGISINILN